MSTIVGDKIKLTNYAYLLNEEGDAFIPEQYQLTGVRKRDEKVVDAIDIDWRPFPIKNYAYQGDMEPGEYIPAGQLIDTEQVLEILSYAYSFSKNIYIEGVMSHNYRYNLKDLFGNRDMMLTNIGFDSYTRTITYYWYPSIGAIDNYHAITDLADYARNSANYGEIFNNYKLNRAHGKSSHAEGFQTIAGFYNGAYRDGQGSHTEGVQTSAVRDYTHSEGHKTLAYGVASHAEGELTVAYAPYTHSEGFHTYITDEASFSHVEGACTYASYSYSHAEGSSTVAYNTYTHVEGHNTVSYGVGSHSEGWNTWAQGDYSHTQGFGTYTFGTAAHSEGWNTYASYDYTHAEGRHTLAYNDFSHTEGNNTVSYGVAGHAEGEATYVYGDYAHAEGHNTYAAYNFSHSEGGLTFAYNTYAHAEGNMTYAIGEASHVEGSHNIASGSFSHAEGQLAYATNIAAHAEGNTTCSLGNSSHAEGFHTYAFGNGSHTEGEYTYATKRASHAEGKNSYAIGDYSHAEGLSTYAFGQNSHTEGTYTYTTGISAHAEGEYTYSWARASHSEGTLAYAYGISSHVEGDHTLAYKDASHAEGIHTYAYGQGAHAEGNYTYSLSNYAHSEGDHTIANTVSAHSEGSFTYVNGLAGHSEGYYAYVLGHFAHAEGSTTYASYAYTHAEGCETLAYNTYAHTEGKWTVSYGLGSHTEGISTWTEGRAAHSEGYHTYGLGINSHSEGNNTYANGDNSHSEGKQTHAEGTNSHSEGLHTWSQGVSTHSEGSLTYAIGNFSHAEGYGSQSYSAYTHAEGEHAIVNYRNDVNNSRGAHAEGYYTYIINGQGAHVEGDNTYVDGNAAHAEGFKTSALNNYTHTEGLATFANGGAAHAEGGFSYAAAWFSHVEGWNTYTYISATYAHAEGLSNIIRNSYAAHAEGARNIIENSYFGHAEGLYAKINGTAAHSEGAYTFANAAYTHASGLFTYAYGESSHSEGSYTKADGHSAHSEGWNTYATGNFSHSEGGITHATYGYTHAEGYGTLAYNTYAHTEGKWNVTYSLAGHNEGILTWTNGVAAHAEGYNTYATYAYTHAEGLHTLAYNDCSHTEGKDTVSLSLGGHSEGILTWTKGDASHAEGYHTYAAYNYSHSEGYLSLSYNTYAHAEGNSTIAGGIASHSEGKLTNATGNFSHAEGYETFATYAYTHAEGCQTLAYNTYTHTEGLLTIASGIASHAEGKNTKSVGTYSHSEGELSQSIGYAAHAEGKSIAHSNYSHSEGYDSRTGRVDNNYANYSHAEGYKTQTLGAGSHSEGNNTIAYGDNSHVEGECSQSQGTSSHAEGLYNISGGNYSHAEGRYAYSIGISSHVEGYNTYAYGDNSHAEGINTLTTATGVNAHAEGNMTKVGAEDAHAEGRLSYAMGSASHVEGISTYAHGDGAHSEGVNTYSYREASHAEGKNTYATGINSHSEGYGTYAAYNFSHAEGASTLAYNTYAHAEGLLTIAKGVASHSEGTKSWVTGYAGHAEGKQTFVSGAYAHGEGEQTYVQGRSAHAEGGSTYATGAYSHAEGHNTYAAYNFSHAEGGLTFAYNTYTHVEGNLTIASGAYAHAEGHNTYAGGIASHAEGFKTSAYGNGSHAEGEYTNTIGVVSHAEGRMTLSKGNYSHAEGQLSYAVGVASHAEGNNTLAQGQNSHAQGQNSIAQGMNSFAAGLNSYAYQSNSVAIGNMSYAFAENSISLGVNTLSYTRRSVAIGNNVVSTYHESAVAIGKYNAPKNGYWFTLGDGTSESARHNAMMIDNSGWTYISALASYINNITVTYDHYTTTYNISEGRRDNFVTVYSYKCIDRGVSDTSSAYQNTYNIKFTTYTIPTKYYIDQLLEAKDVFRFAGTVTFSGTMPPQNPGTYPEGDLAHNPTAMSTVTWNPVHDSSIEHNEDEITYYAPDRKVGAIWRATNAGYFGTEYVAAGDLLLSYSNVADATNNSGWAIIDTHVNFITNAPSLKTNQNERDRVITSLHLKDDGTMTYTYAPLVVKDVWEGKNEAQRNLSDDTYRFNGFISNFAINTDDNKIEFGYVRSTFNTVHGPGTDNNVYGKTYDYTWDWEAKAQRLNNRVSSNEDKVTFIENIHLDNYGVLSYGTLTLNNVRKHHYNEGVDNATYHSRVNAAYIQKRNATTLTTYNQSENITNDNIAVVTNVYLNPFGHLSYSYTYVHGLKEHHNTYFEPDKYEVSYVNSDADVTEGGNHHVDELTVVGYVNLNKYGTLSYAYHTIKGLRNHHENHTYTNNYSINVDANGADAAPINVLRLTYISDVHMTDDGRLSYMVSTYTVNNLRKHHHTATPENTTNKSILNRTALNENNMDIYDVSSNDSARIVSYAYLSCDGTLHTSYYEITSLRDHHKSAKLTGAYDINVDNGGADSVSSHNVLKFSYSYNTYLTADGMFGYTVGTYTVKNLRTHHHTWNEVNGGTASGQMAARTSATEKNKDIYKVGDNDSAKVLSYVFLTSDGTLHTSYYEITSLRDHHKSAILTGSYSIDIDTGGADSDTSHNKLIFSYSYNTYLTADGMFGYTVGTYSVDNLRTHHHTWAEVKGGSNSGKMVKRTSSAEKDMNIYNVNQTAKVLSYAFLTSDGTLHTSYYEITNLRDHHKSAKLTGSYSIDVDAGGADSVGHNNFIFSYSYNTYLTVDGLFGYTVGTYTIENLRTHHHTWEEVNGGTESGQMAARNDAKENNINVFDENQTAKVLSYAFLTSDGTLHTSYYEISNLQEHHKSEKKTNSTTINVDKNGANNTSDNTLVFTYSYNTALSRDGKFSYTVATYTINNLRTHHHTWNELSYDTKGGSGANYKDLNVDAAVGNGNYNRGLHVLTYNYLTTDGTLHSYYANVTNLRHHHHTLGELNNTNSTTARGNLASEVNRDIYLSNNDLKVLTYAYINESGYLQTYNATIKNLAYHHKSAIHTSSYTINVDAGGANSVGHNVLTFSYSYNTYLTRDGLFGYTVGTYTVTNLRTHHHTIGEISYTGSGANYKDLNVDAAVGNGNYNRGLHVLTYNYLTTDGTLHSYYANVTNIRKHHHTLSELENTTTTGRKNNSYELTRDIYLTNEPFKVLTYAYVNATGYLQTYYAVAYNMLEHHKSSKATNSNSINVDKGGADSTTSDNILKFTYISKAELSQDGIFSYTVSTYTINNLRTHHHTVAEVCYIDGDNDYKDLNVDAATTDLTNFNRGLHVLTYAHITSDGTFHASYAYISNIRKHHHTLAELENTSTTGRKADTNKNERSRDVYNSNDTLKVLTYTYINDAGFLQTYYANVSNLRNHHKSAEATSAYTINVDALGADKEGHNTLVFTYSHKTYLTTDGLFGYTTATYTVTNLRKHHHTVPEFAYTNGANEYKSLDVDAAVNTIDYNRNLHVLTYAYITTDGTFHSYYATISNLRKHHHTLSELENTSTTGRKADANKNERSRDVYGSNDELKVITYAYINNTGHLQTYYANINNLLEHHKSSKATDSNSIDVDAGNNVLRFTYISKSELSKDGIFAYTVSTYTISNLKTHHHTAAEVNGGTADSPMAARSDNSEKNINVYGSNQTAKVISYVFLDKDGILHSSYYEITNLRNHHKSSKATNSNSIDVNSSATGDNGFKISYISKVELSQDGTLSYTVSTYSISNLRKHHHLVTPTGATASLNINTCGHADNAADDLKIIYVDGISFDDYGYLSYHYTTYNVSNLANHHSNTGTEITNGSINVNGANGNVDNFKFTYIAGVHITTDGKLTYTYSSYTITNLRNHHTGSISTDDTTTAPNFNDSFTIIDSVSLNEYGTLSGTTRRITIPNLTTSGSSSSYLPMKFIRQVGVNSSSPKQITYVEDDIWGAI